MEKSMPGDRKELRYAGFWQRAGALIVDFTLCVMALWIFELVASRLLYPAVWSAIAMLGLSTALSAFESSKLQATPGKLMFGLIVTDIHGNRASFARAAVRNFGHILTKLTFGVGYLMNTWTSKRQTLHDIAANCLVLRKPD